MPTGMRDSKLKVPVSLISGRSFNVICSRRTSVRGFIQSLAEHTGVDWFTQRLFKGGDELDDHKTLGTSGVARNTVIMVVCDDDAMPPLGWSDDD